MFLAESPDIASSPITMKKSKRKIKFNQALEKNRHSVANRGDLENNRYSIPIPTQEST